MAWRLVPVDGGSKDWPRQIAQATNYLIGKEGGADNHYVRQAQGAAWTAATGVAARTALVSYPGQVVSNPPTQAEVQALDDALKAHSQALVALITDLKANGALT